MKPPPTTSRRAGISGPSSAAVESIPRSEASMPRRRAGTEPVATIACRNFSACGSSPSTRTVRASSKTPRPPTTSTPLAFATLPSPRASLPITRSDFHLRSGSSETRAGPKSTPNSLARSASPSTAATCSSALDGMQPSKRQAPPSRLPASTTTVSSPSSAQRNAAEMPPGPPPTTTTSTSRTRSPITIALPVDQQALGALEAADDRGAEARAVGAVGHAVVEGQRQRQDQARLDPALAYHRLLAGAGHAQDPDLPT